MELPPFFNLDALRANGLTGPERENTDTLNSRNSFTDMRNAGPNLFPVVSVWIFCPVRALEAWPVLKRYCCPRPSVIRIQIEAVGLFLELRIKNDAVIKGKFSCTCVLVIWFAASSRLNFCFRITVFSKTGL